MNKLHKLTCAKVFKVIFYLLGFPLLLLLVVKDSMGFFDQPIFTETASKGITVICLLWLGLTCLHIGLYLVMKKMQALRTIILVVVAVSITAGSVAAIDSRGGKYFEDLQAKYAGTGVSIQDYKKQTQWFSALSDKSGNAQNLVADVNNFMRVYGLSDYYPTIYSHLTQLNTVPTVVTPDGKVHAIADVDDVLNQSPWVYNPNGLLYDGYVFGVENAISLLLEYHAITKNSTVYRQIATTDTVSATDAQANGYYVKNATSGAYAKFTTTSFPDASAFGGVYYEQLELNAALDKAVSELTDENDGITSAWEEYVANPETDYAAKKAAADQYVLTADRLDEVLDVLFEYIGKNPAVNQLLGGLNITSIVTILNALLATNEAYINDGSIGNVLNQLFYGSQTGSNDTTGIVLPVQYLFENLTFGANSFSYTASDVTASQAINSGGYYIVTQKYVYDATNEQYVIQMAYEEYTSTIEGNSNYTTAADALAADPNETGVPNDNIYYNGTFYTRTPLTQAYAAYAARLNSDSTVHPNIAALADLLASLNPLIPMLGGLLGGTLVGVIKDALPIDLSIVGLTDAKLLSVIPQILGLLDLSALTPEATEDLLMGILSEISFYQHPDLKVEWQFIGESDATQGDHALDSTVGGVVDLNRWAWVKFHCEKWGIANGCVLMTSSGLLTGSTLGNGASADDGFAEAALLQLQADLSYKQDWYPLFAARRYLAMWSGVLAMSIFLTIYCYNKERKLTYELILNGGEN